MSKRNTVIINGLLMAGILAVSTAGTVHAGRTSSDYRIGYQNGYTAGAQTVMKMYKDAWGSGFCASAEAGTDMIVLHYGLNNRVYCNQDRQDAGWYALGGANGGALNGTTVCWWTQGKQLTMVLDSGMMTVGTDYCQQNSPKGS